MGCVERFEAAESAIALKAVGAGLTGVLEVRSAGLTDQKGRMNTNDIVSRK
jgi:hypothetical protein